MRKTSKSTDTDEQEFRHQVIQAGIDALPQEMREAALNDPDKLPDGLPATPLHEAPRRTLREVMADGVSSLSLGPEDLISLEESYVPKNKERHRP